MADKYRGYTLDKKWVYGEKIECKWQGKDIIMIKPENEPFIYPADKDGKFDEDIVEMLVNFVPSKKPLGAERVALACNAIAVIPESIGKWLGTDSNGNDIYEKDRVLLVPINWEIDKNKKKHNANKEIIIYATRETIGTIEHDKETSVAIVTVDLDYCKKYPFCDNELNDKYREDALFKAQIIGTRAEIVGNYVHLDTTRCWADYIIVNGSRIGHSAFDKLRQEWEVHMDNNGLPIARISAEAYPIYIKTLRRVEENDDEQ